MYKFKHIYLIIAHVTDRWPSCDVMWLSCYPQITVMWPSTVMGICDCHVTIIWSSYAYHVTILRDVFSSQFFKNQLGYCSRSKQSVVFILECNLATRTQFVLYLYRYFSSVICRLLHVVLYSVCILKGHPCSWFKGPSIFNELAK